MRAWKWTLVGASLVVLVTGLWAVQPSCSASLPGSTEPPATGDHDVGSTDAEASVEPDAVPEEAAEAALEEEAQEAVVEAPEAAQEVVEEAVEAVPATLAEKFVAAGGQKLCLAMVYQLNPDWRMDVCQTAKEGEDGTDRKTECENQRRPLVQFAEDVCRTVIEESLRLDLDPGLVLAVIERESSFGRATWSRQNRQYEIQTDICKLTLPLSRIVERRPGRREGTELMTWTYGPQAPRSGEVARNRQPVIVVEENEETITVNTCAAGERGIMQTVPRELRTAGDAIGLTGSTAQRAAAVEIDPVLQVRIGCQALADHRALVPEDQQVNWETWIFAYNSGSPTPTEHGREYVVKIIRHYRASCQGWMLMDESNPMSAVDVEDVWPECTRLEGALENLSPERG